MKRGAGDDLSISPDSVMCAGEPLTAESRSDIEDAFGCPLSNLYAATEVGIVARSYPGSPGLHLNEDIAVYEPVDGANRPVAPGTRARRLLVTNVINHALPLIRYELTDEVTVLDEPNPGPWTGRRIADIEGRSDDTFSYEDVEVHPYVFRSAIGRRREVLEYQVRQTEAGAEIALRTESPIDTDALTSELSDQSSCSRPRKPGSASDRRRSRPSPGQRRQGPDLRAPRQGGCRRRRPSSVDQRRFGGLPGSGAASRGSDCSEDADAGGPAGGEDGSRDSGDGGDE